jgi:hypothetical protein
MKLKHYHFINNLLYLLTQIIQILVFSKVENINYFFLFLAVFFTSFFLTLYKMNVRDQINSYENEYATE